MGNGFMRLAAVWRTGKIYVYNSSGEQINTIGVPNRPPQLVFGGGDDRKLFIAARASLYGVSTKTKGR